VHLIFAIFRVRASMPMLREDQEKSKNSNYDVHI